MLQLAEDDGQEVRIKNLKVIAAFVSNLGADQLASFIPILNKAKADTKWRIRLQALQSVIQISVEIKVTFIIIIIFRTSINSSWTLNL